MLVGLYTQLTDLQVQQGHYCQYYEVVCDSRPEYTEEGGQSYLQTTQDSVIPIGLFPNGPHLLLATKWK